MKTKKELVSVIIPTFNRKELVCRCIYSVLHNNYAPVEIIIIDNNSTDGTLETLRVKFKRKITIIRSENNLLAGGGRNLGASRAKGEYLLFIDSDNIIEKEMISRLVSASREHPNAAILGPLMLYETRRKIIWWAGSNVNKLTSKTTYLEIGNAYHRQGEDVYQVGHVPNVMMFTRKVFQKVKGFDTESFPMHYEEPDIAERIRQLGYIAICVPGAITYHNTPINYNDKKGEGLALNDKNRAYYNIRNRILFMKKYGSNFNIFVLIFLPVFFTAYAILLLRIKRPELIQYLITGAKDGLSEKI